MSVRFKNEKGQEEAEGKYEAVEERKETWTTWVRIFGVSELFNIIRVYHQRRIPLAQKFLALIDARHRHGEVELTHKSSGSSTIIEKSRSRQYPEM
jgi:hypothetical protein